MVKNIKMKLKIIRSYQLKVSLIQLYKYKLSKIVKIFKDLKYNHQDNYYHKIICLLEHNR